MSNAIEQAIAIVGTQEELARLAKVTQAAISVLKNGRNGRPVIPRFKTAKQLSEAVDGKIPWYRFMEEEQGEPSRESEQLSQRHERSSLSNKQAQSSRLTETEQVGEEVE